MSGFHKALHNLELKESAEYKERKKNRLSEEDEKIIDDYVKGTILQDKICSVIDELESVKFRTGSIIPKAYELYNSIFFEFTQPYFKRFL